MKKAPSILAAALLAAFLCLGSSGSYAQCNICVSAYDATCSGTYADCQTNLAGCGSSNTFTVPCTGSYDFGAKIVCSGACNCSACVIVAVNATTYIVGQTESGCPVQSCNNLTSISLVAGVTYRLYVCKRPCDGDEINCNNCPGDCRAWGWINHNVANCP